MSLENWVWLAEVLRFTIGSCQSRALATIIYVFTTSVPTASAMALSLFNLFKDWLLWCMKVPIFGNICSHYIWSDCIMRDLHVRVFMVCMLSKGDDLHSSPSHKTCALYGYVKVPISMYYIIDTTYVWQHACTSW